jgi:hypothetical protein
MVSQILCLPTRQTSESKETSLRGRSFQAHACDCSPVELLVCADVLHLPGGCISSLTRMMSIGSEQLDLALSAR